MNIYLEIFGYIGTALVIFSMLMTSVVKLRVFNICGSVISLIYAAINNTWPIVLLNASLILINVFQLIRMNSKKTTFNRVKTSLNDASVKYFLELYGEELRQYFPKFDPASERPCEVHLAYAGSEAVGIIIGQRLEDEMHIEVDYATPRFRDLSVSTFLLSELAGEGITKLYALAGGTEHRNYLIKMGFTDEDGLMVKSYK